MVKNHWNTTKICLFTTKICLFVCQTTKQLLSNFEPLKSSKNTSNFEGWGRTLVSYKKEHFPELDCNIFSEILNRLFPILKMMTTAKF